MEVGYTNVHLPVKSVGARRDTDAVGEVERGERVSSVLKGEKHLIVHLRKSNGTAVCTTPEKMSVLKGGLLLLQMFLHTPRAAASAEESDPCHNHTVLNEAWRATTNLDQSDNKCDRSVKWLGWYRMFYLGMSVQIPEVCVPTQRCGTDAPLWLDGPHPSLEDGIVTRSVCGHWSKNCCHFKSSSIQVKTCPGNYSVYELVAPSGCSLAYCADVSSTTAPTDQLPTTPKPRTLFQQRLRLSMVLQRDLSPTEMNQMPSQIRGKLIQMGYPSDLTVKML
ncbi:pancreatic secretory granule membrane major glycoprotein GP2 isoform X3 [Alosa sapidissima]|uniref:pancreatic secretory granule membrane major glycoprotein GP2 isoform X3 n=1 Tax=Alosa sapidissima TaxID=34773 RepID=UPI001C09276A|nr:pancreatic secretory granule membrane major glycoprotein GP2 isoform X3 [Alosa sapidissima]